jgi:YD repeat-containing protein
LEPSWSPDGEAIAFVAGEGLGAIGSMDIQVWDVRTGEVVTISTPSSVWDLSWDAEGFIIASVTADAGPSPPIRGDGTAPTLDPWPGDW